MSRTPVVTDSSNYTHTERVFLMDERASYLKWLTNHYRTCPECMSEFTCDSRRLEYVRSEIVSLDLALGYDVPDNEYDSRYYFSETRQLEFYEDNYDELVSSTTVPQVEALLEVGSSTGTWFDQETYDWLANAPEPTAQQVHTWANEQAFDSEEAAREYQRALDALLDAGLSALRGQGYHLTDDPYGDPETTSANFRKIFRIWATPKGEVGIYRTFIRKVTESDFEAYCAPCKRGFVFDRSIASIVAVILHAHKHLPNSVIAGDTDPDSGSRIIVINGSDAMPSPGEDELTDKQYVLRTAYWYTNRRDYLAAYGGLTRRDAVLAQEYAYLTYQI